MALPQPDVVGILNRRACLPVVGCWRGLWVVGGVKAEQTLSASQMQPSSQLLHSYTLLCWHYFPFCVHILYDVRTAVKMLPGSRPNPLITETFTIIQRVFGQIGWACRNQIRKNKPIWNEELLHNNKAHMHVLGVWGHHRTPSNLFPVTQILCLVLCLGKLTFKFINFKLFLWRLTLD